ncbi:hypothetical protein AYJ57_03095 [Salipiger sp. CCB-MM3]|uniref:DUF1697 domain-containing protein n=1 Tax=Salipiger sp. CCB-MM3 TaxID=1792508 RepID=UPI00080AB81F|nr:DUF1697 domain-containing protein [Salipiger sp. CCB-MM3]ANT59437.1 hypothetical protein AYJ57_03095 [Salipiger sp. CCB-MM3]
MALNVALLRGINVGGANALPMAKLRALCEGLGWQEVQSHLASGNLLFDAEDAPEALAAALQRVLSGLGLDVPVLVLPPERLRAALERCPFAPDEPKRVHVGFLFAPASLTPASLDRALFERFAAPGDEIAEGEGMIWLHTPGGFGRSKLAPRLEAIAGAPLTARNLSSLAKLVEMLDARDAPR